MEFIRLKNEITWTAHSEGIAVYQGNKELQFFIKTDKNEAFFEFLDFLSVGRTVSEVEAYSKLSAEEKSDILDYLGDKKFIQIFDGEEKLDRTDKFINSFPTMDFRDFRAYCNSVRVILVGLGTVGSHALDILVRLGFQQIIIIDGDTVERKNISAQAYFPEDIGKYKVDVMTSRFSAIVPIKSFKCYVKSVSTLDSLVNLSDNDIIINAADDYQLMLDLSKAVLNSDIDCKIIESGYGPLVQTAYVIDNRESAAYFYRYISKTITEGNKKIADNSGSIFNGYLSAFMIGRLLLPFSNDKKYHIGHYNFYNDVLTWKKGIE